MPLSRPKYEAAPPRRADSGFVLIGVVMFVLALTILGLSLFSLSGFETQFLEDSRKDMQAFYNASGGLERARQILEIQDDLEAVKRNLPLAGVDYASARHVETGDSTGPVAWNGSKGPVEIRVRGTEGGHSRLLEARFDPTEGTPYSNLIASCSFVYPSLEGGTVSRMSLNGPIQQNDPDASWADAANGSHTVTIGGVSSPAVDAYIASHLAAYGGSFQQPAVEEPDPVTHGRTYHLDLGGVQFYKLDNTSGYTFDFRDDGSVLPVTVKVAGTAIWVCPKGAEFERTFTVDGSPSDRLIIVAGPSTNVELQSEGLYPLGIHIQGGIQSPSVPVILVSNAAIAIDQHRDLAKNLSVLTYLSIYGQSVGLAGSDSGHSTTWIHPSGSDAGILDPLLAAGLLPLGSSGSSHLLTLQSGSWREIR